MRPSAILERVVSVGVEVCSVCQLACPGCPTQQGGKEALVGAGMLDPDRFRAFLDRNPGLERVELAAYGEVFLHKRLPEILACAAERGVATSIGCGANLNHAPEESLEAVVRYGVTRIRCAIDGATNASYRTYRVNGDLRRVIANIKIINRYKRLYKTAAPELIYQFVVFGHNEHETKAAAVLARMLDMKIFFRLNASPELHPVRDRWHVRGLLGYADREEYTERRKEGLCRELCAHMWTRPQINWDGRLMGCQRNEWSAYADDALGGDLLASCNNERMTYARRMLLGEAPPRDDVPCTRCEVYADMVRFDNFIQAAEIEK
jgi:hypothetical protein